MNNQKGVTLLLGVLIGVIMIGALGATYYLGTQMNDRSELQQSTSANVITSPSAVALFTPNPTDSMKTYVIEKYGSSFKYPSNYVIEVINDVDAQLLLSIKGPEEEYSLDVGKIGEGYSKYPPYSKSEGTKVFNNKTWEIIPARTFGDAGETFSSGQKYQINNGKNRFDFELIKPKESTPTYEQMISSFEFLN